MQPTDLVSAVPPGTIVFPTTTKFDFHDRIVWNGEDLPAFLEAAKRAAAPFLYLWCKRDGEADSDLMIAELSFVANGCLHSFIARSPGVEEDDEEEDHEGEAEDDESDWDKEAAREEELVRRLAASATQIREALVPWLKSEEGAVGYSLHSLREAIKSMLVDKFEFPDGDSYMPKFEAAVVALAKQAQKDLDRAERDELDAVTARCTAWARGNGVKSLALGDVELFLREAKVLVSHEGVRKVWQKVKFDLKAKK